MRKNLRVAGVFFAALLPAVAAIDGTIVNGTSGQPQPGVIVMLTQPGQAGMSTLGTVKSDAAGKFHFDKDSPGGPQFVQAIFGGVLYTKTIPPGMPSTGVQVEIYDSSPKTGSAQVAQDLILLQPSANQVAVNESIFFENKSKTTFNNPKNGTLHFYLPPEANDKVSLSVTSPGGIPVNRAVKKGEKNVYSVDYPIRPGETRFDLTYTLAAASQPLTFSGKVLEAQATRLAAPPGVTLVSSDIAPLGQEPTTKATIYDVKNKNYKVELQGTGTLAASADDGTVSEEDSGAPKIEEIQPRLYNHMGWILGMALGILGLGLFLLYRSDKPVPAAASGSASGQKPARKGAVSR
jgi:hypothetical protein